MERRKRKGGDVVSFLIATGAFLLLFPRPLYAAEVGCFCTFVFISLMFAVCTGLTVLFKFLLSRAFLPVSWTRIILITFTELLIIILVFVVIQAGYLGSLLIYFPLAAGVNMLALKGSVRHAPAPVKTAKKLAHYALSALSLPVAIQLSGALFKLISGAITFTELRV